MVLLQEMLENLVTWKQNVCTWSSQALVSNEDTQPGLSEEFHFLSMFLFPPIHQHFTSCNRVSLYLHECLNDSE